MILKQDSYCWPVHWHRPYMLHGGCRNICCSQIKHRYVWRAAESFDTHQTTGRRAGPWHWAGHASTSRRLAAIEEGLSASCFLPISPMLHCWYYHAMLAFLRSIIYWKAGLGFLRWGYRPQRERCLTSIHIERNVGLTSTFRSGRFKLKIMLDTWLGKGLQLLLLLLLNFTKGIQMRVLKDTQPPWYGLLKYWNLRLFCPNGVTTTSEGSALNSPKLEPLGTVFSVMAGDECRLTTIWFLHCARAGCNKPFHRLHRYGPVKQKVTDVLPGRRSDMNRKLRRNPSPISILLSMPA